MRLPDASVVLELELELASGAVSVESTGDLSRGDELIATELERRSEGATLRTAVYVSGIRAELLTARCESGQWRAVTRRGA